MSVYAVRYCIRRMQLYSSLHIFALTSQVKKEGSKNMISNWFCELINWAYKTVSDANYDCQVENPIGAKHCNVLTLKKCFAVDQAL